MNIGDAVYLKSPEADQLATVVGAFNGRLQLAIDTDEGTKLVSVYARECVSERGYSIQTRRCVLNACRTLRKRSQTLLQLNAFELVRLLEREGLSAETARECAGFFIRSEWEHEMAPLRRWLQRIRQRFCAATLSTPLPLQEAA